MCATCKWADTLGAAEEAMERLDELPSRAAEFRDGVEDRLRGIIAWIEREEHVTEKMADAIDNMSAAIDKWIR